MKELSVQKSFADALRKNKADGKRKVNRENRK